MSTASMKSAVTVSLVPAARGGPFVFWDDLAAACGIAHELGFDAVEIFAEGPAMLAPTIVQPLLKRFGLQVATVGTGAGWVMRQLHLCDPDADRRRDAREFIRSMIDAGAQHHAPAVIGSMQGRWSPAVPKEQALAWLVDALNDLGEHARKAGVPLLYEPLNRYETNLVNTLAEGSALLRRLQATNVQLLADLFHMNIEETDLPNAILAASRDIGHVHFVDTNRRAAGLGRLEFKPIVAALTHIGYAGYLSAEALPLPDSRTAAEQTMEMFRRLVQ